MKAYENTGEKSPDVERTQNSTLEQTSLTATDAPLLENPDGWQHPETLRELFCERVWPIQRIADHFDAIADEDVTCGKVTYRLDRHGISRDAPTAKSGLARKLEATDADALGGAN